MQSLVHRHGEINAQCDVSFQAARLLTTARGGGYKVATIHSLTRR